MKRDELIKKIDGRLVIASVSGGKDSAAMCLYLKELGIPYQAVFCDTGWEHPETYRYLRETLPPVIGPIQWLSPKLPMVDLIRKKGMFPSRVVRFCTQELKAEPMKRFLADLDDEPLNVVGIRAAESEARSKMAEWEWSDGFDCETWRPLIGWSTDDVIAIHRRHGLAPNPLYLQGATRVGCWPCIFARKAEIRLLAESDPGRIALIRELEREMTVALKQRVAERGEEQRWSELTYFQGPSKKARQNRETWPIDKAALWSMTARGGRQFEMFAPDFGAEGCMRWGLCETHETA